MAQPTVPVECAALHTTLQLVAGSRLLTVATGAAVHDYARLGRVAVVEGPRSGSSGASSRWSPAGTGRPCRPSGRCARPCSRAPRPARATSRPDRPTETGPGGCRSRAYFLACATASAMSASSFFIASSSVSSPTIAWVTRVTVPLNIARFKG